MHHMLLGNLGHEQIELGTLSSMLYNASKFVLLVLYRYSVRLWNSTRMVRCSSAWYHYLLDTMHAGPRSGLVAIHIRQRNGGTSQGARAIIRAFAIGALITIMQRTHGVFEEHTKYWYTGANNSGSSLYCGPYCDVFSFV